MDSAELIKALRYCSDNEKEEGCDECPYLYNGMCRTMLSDAAYALEAADKRIAELEAQLPKEGEWIEDTTTYAGPCLSNYKCSLCGKICGTWRRGLKPSELPNWCGNCGARMKGEQE